MYEVVQLPNTSNKSTLYDNYFQGLPQNEKMEHSKVGFLDLHWHPVFHVHG